MNFIEDKERRYEGTVADVCSVHSDETAFIGRVGNGPRGELYLLTFNRIVLARNPRKTWSDDTPVHYIEEFVDIEIKIIERDKGG